MFLVFQVRFLSDFEDILDIFWGLLIFITKISLVLLFISFIDFNRATKFEE